MPEVGILLKIKAITHNTFQNRSIGGVQMVVVRSQLRICLCVSIRILLLFVVYLSGCLSIPYPRFCGQFAHRFHVFNPLYCILCRIYCINFC
jgi:hypothetical protein